MKSFNLQGKSFHSYFLQKRTCKCVRTSLGTHSLLGTGLELLWQKEWSAFFTYSVPDALPTVYKCLIPTPKGLWRRGHYYPHFAYWGNWGFKRWHHSFRVSELVSGRGQNELALAEDLATSVDCCHIWLKILPHLLTQLKALLTNIKK